MKNEFKFKAKVWIYPGPAAWHFVTLPKGISKEIKQIFGELARGWGSLPVTVTIEKASWNTSIFPDKKIGAYLLPIKSDIRKKEMILSGHTIYLKLIIKV